MPKDTGGEGLPQEATAAVPSRRRFLLRTMGISIGAGTVVASESQLSHALGLPGGGDGSSGHHHTGSSPAGHGGGVNGAMFRTGQVVDHKANGFNPTATLRDFDYGVTSVLPNGRVLREWDVVASQREIEVAPGVSFPAWTFNGRIPGPTLRCSAGERLRIRFTNATAHPHTMHFHGIHPAEMDGVPMVGRGTIGPGQRVHLRVRRRAVRCPPLPLPRGPACRAHLTRHVWHLHHRPAFPAQGGG